MRYPHFIDLRSRCNLKRQPTICNLTTATSIPFRCVFNFFFQFRAFAFSYNYDICAISLHWKRIRICFLLLLSVDLYSYQENVQLNCYTHSPSAHKSYECSVTSRSYFSFIYFSSFSRRIYFFFFSIRAYRVHISSNSFNSFIQITTNQNIGKTHSGICLLTLSSFDRYVCVSIVRRWNKWLKLMIQ